eukprot:scaffold32018_cov44-Attheya_sp.AAC.1
MWRRCVVPVMGRSCSTAGRRVVSRAVMARWQWNTNHAGICGKLGSSSNGSRIGAAASSRIIVQSEGSSGNKCCEGGEECLERGDGGAAEAYYGVAIAHSDTS